MSSMRIKSRDNPNLEISAFRGHFATRHSHNSHYLDITRMKHEYGMAADAASILVQHYIYEKKIDTIVCMDGSEVIGTFLAGRLAKNDRFSVNSGRNVYIVTPEYDSNGQLIFRDNLTGMVSGKNVLLLISTVNSGKTARRAMECIEYYGGSLQGSPQYSARLQRWTRCGDEHLLPEDIPGYMTSLVPDCPLCRADRKSTHWPTAMAFPF